MSSAFYPLAMNKYNNRKNPHNYESWKGTGTQRNPVGTTRGNIRPLTNNDLTNATPYKFGKARPMKWQYRKGSCAQANLPITILDPCCPDFDVFIWLILKELYNIMSGLELTNPINSAVSCITEGIIIGIDSFTSTVMSSWFLNT